MDRGFEHLIDIWGADHHGYVPRMKAVFTALPPHDPDRLELIIGQLVNLLESGEARRMCKRRGDIVTVDDLIDAIGVDAVRFFMVGRSHDSTLDLDLDLAVRAVEQEPGLLRAVRARAHLQHPAQPGCGGRAGGGPAGAAARRAGLRRGRGRRLRAQPGAHALARFPLVVLEAVERRAPHRVHGYLGELAAEFHVFYRNCRVLSDDPEVAAFRTGLCVATRTTLAEGLELLGVSAPREHVTRRRAATAAGRRRASTGAGAGLAAARPRQATKCSSAYLRSSSACSGSRSRSSPSRCESARLARPRNSRWTTLSRIVLATSLPGMAGV